VLVAGAAVALVLLLTPGAPPAPPGPAPAAAPVVVPAAVPAADAPVPVELVLPDGTTSAVVPVGVAADGQMEVPERVAEVGWYRYGPAPGVPGSSVLAGHVDDREQGPGAFARLDELATEQTVLVRRAGAPEQRWRVVDVRSVDKGDLDLPALFGRDGPARLTLVTCGGVFDRGSRQYEDNVVVTAVPR
jgi:hypothetical protein